MKLSQLRQKINAADRKIVSLLNQRAKISKQIGELKARSKKSAYVPDREKEVYESIAKNNKGPLSDYALQAVYAEIMSGSLALEKEITIAYLGPPATFTHIAALKKFGSQVRFYPAKSISDIFTEVERGRCDYGVVPIENSVEGAVNHTLDMFIESDLKICSEISLEISHNLLAKCKMNKIKKIYSNPQVFGQCRLWLESNLPNAELIEVSSTTKAAEHALSERNAAAIASKLAAGCYGLKVLAASIEDSAHNVTRFLVIGEIESQPTRKDKTSIVFSVKDKVGVLHDMLVPFKKNRINLTKIESRPSKRRPWEYYFFIDMQGHIQRETVKKSIAQLNKHCTYLKILGSYPAA